MVSKKLEATTPIEETFEIDPIQKSKAKNSK